MDFLVEYLESEVEMESEKTLIRNKKKNNFNSEEKKRLCDLVKGRPAIWDLGHKSHSNTEAVYSEWRNIAREMNKTVDECKMTWKSLRGSLRYHTAAKKKFKSGSGASSVGAVEEHLCDDQSADWEFSENLSFLGSISEKRLTFSSMECENAPSTSGQNEPEVLSSCYSFSPRPQKKDPMLENVTKLTDTVTELISIRRSEAPSQPPLENYTLLANLDRVFKQLPSEVVEDLGLSFQQQAVAELRKLRRHGSN